MAKRGYFGIGLHMPKTNYNVAQVLRAAACYDAAFVNISGQRYKNSSVDTTKADKHLPLFQNLLSPLDNIPRDCQIISVEITENARDLRRFVHPERAMYVLGPEDGSIPKEIIERSQSVVKIPTHFCMNLAATVNVLLYDRLLKSNERTVI